MRESETLTAVLRYLGNRRDCRVWRNNTGVLPDREGRVVSFGLKGSADVLGLTDKGRFLAVECKSATGRLSDAQRAFRDMIQAHGGLYFVVRQVSDLYPSFPPEPTPHP